VALLVKCREATIRGWAEQHFGTAAAGALLAGRTTAPDLALGIFTGGGGSSGFIMDVARHGSGNSGGGGGDGATGHQAGGDGDCSELDGTAAEGSALQLSLDQTQSSGGAVAINGMDAVPLLVAASGGAVHLDQVIRVPFSNS